MSLSKYSLFWRFVFFMICWSQSDKKQKMQEVWKHCCKFKSRLLDKFSLLDGGSTSLEVAVIHMRSFFILSNPIILLHAVFCLSDFYVTVTVRVCLVKLFLSNKKERHEVIQSIRYWLFKQKPFCLVSGFFQFLCILRSLFISIYCCACMYLLLLIAVYKPNCLSGTLKCYSALLLSKWCVCVIISCSTWCCWASIFCTQSSFGNASGCSHCGTFWFSNIRVCCHANCGTPSSTRKALCCFCNTFMCMWTVTTQFGMMRNFLVTKHLKVKKKCYVKKMILWTKRTSCLSVAISGSPWLWQGYTYSS